MARRKLDVRQAAEALGTSVDAVRKRIRRGTLESTKEDDRVYVWLDTGQDDRERDPYRDELVEELRDRVRSLEEANRENRRIIAALTSRIPEIEAPPEQRESPETATQGREGVDTPQEERRSWWRRFFDL